MSLYYNASPACLLLSDGTVYNGCSFGAEGTSIGEVVFTTAMTGYEETLSDPSYYGQIVTQTFPLIGNYGVNDADYESDGSCVSGYIVREWCDTPSNFRMEGNIDSFLKKHNIIGLYGIDTRSLTRKIREFGVMNGIITTESIKENKEELLNKLKAYTVRNAVASVSRSTPLTYKADNEKYHIALFDFGYKHNIRRELIKRGCTVTVVPSSMTAEEIKALAPDGIMLSNGPGDPAENVAVIANLKEITKLSIPTFGICLGHQLLALASGARTQKLKYGHRGANQPVIDMELDKTFVTSQNHGYAVIGDSLDESVGAVSHINANDGTCEGVRYKAFPAFTVQFHPEACGGPHDTAYLFDEFIGLIEKHKGGEC